MSIAHIAQAARVSYATAWRIINNHPCRSPEAVRAVREAVTRLGYSPSQTRRGRPRKISDGIRTHNVALLHFRTASSISTSVLADVQRMLGERNLNLIFAHVDDVAELPQALRSGNVDGILGYGRFPDEAVTPALRRVPAVWMMSRWDGGADAWGDRVKPDHQAIGRLAAQYLIGRGHEHVAYFNPAPPQGVYTEREIAFRAAAEGRARQVSVMRSDEASADVQHFAEMDRAAGAFVKQWLAASHRPTGVFVPVDRVTLRVYRHLLQHHVQPGRDLEIVSCDKEEDLLSLMNPQPKSIDLNRQAVARFAVERLLWRMRHGNSAPSVCMTVSPVLDGELNELWAPAEASRSDSSGDGELKASSKRSRAPVAKGI